MLDIRRGLVTRFTDDPDEDIFPLWSGNRIIYSVVRNGQISLYQKDIITGRKELIVPPQREETFASDTSSDGRYLIYQRMNARSDGAELFYVAPDGKLMTTATKPSADNKTIDIGTPVPLFAGQMPLRPSFGFDYMATSDGQRFLLNRLLRDTGDTAVRVVLNWSAGR